MGNKILLFFIGILFSLNTYSQHITGIVLDQQSHDTISFASVYFNGTFTGTHTDHRGRFSLDLLGKPAMPIIVSAIGYYSVTITEYAPGTPITVFMSPKVYEMPEVVVSAESLAKERSANLKIFNREFLGTSIYAVNSDILNEKDITFNYGRDKDTLRAYALNPIQIHNKSLGLNLTYYLDKFEYNRGTSDFLIRGNIFFEEDTINIKNKQRTEKRRRHAYLGSIMHFFRALWADQLKKEGFSVVTLPGKALTSKDIVIEDSIGKYFCTPEVIYIAYSGKNSFVKFLSDRVVFYKNGEYDYTGISWTGKMSLLRIGDWLPYEYGETLSGQSDNVQQVGRSDAHGSIKKGSGEGGKTDLHRAYANTSPPNPLSGLSQVPLPVHLTPQPPLRPVVGTLACTPHPRPPLRPVADTLACTPHPPTHLRPVVGTLACTPHPPTPSLVCRRYPCLYTSPPNPLS